MMDEEMHAYQQRITEEQQAVPEGEYYACVWRKYKLICERLPNNKCVVTIDLGGEVVYDNHSITLAFSKSDTWVDNLTIIPLGPEMSARLRGFLKLTPKTIDIDMLLPAEAGEGASA